MPRRSPESPTRPVPQEAEWGNLLNEALDMPGGFSDTYNRFYSYSFLNQVLLFSQGVQEPVATYKKWLELGRQVQKGSKAKSILRPITVKLKDELDAEGNPKQITKFKMVNCLFGVSETEGADLPEYTPPEWSEQRALGSLAINRVAFNHLDGNVQGFSYDRNVAVSPVAKYPFKTLVHELGHIVVGHTSPDQVDEYKEHRGVMEFQAEGTAFLVMKELSVPESEWNPAESRAYIQHWLDGERPDGKRIKGIFSAVDAILKAGRSEVMATR